MGNISAEVHIFSVCSVKERLSWLSCYFFLIGDTFFPLSVFLGVLGCDWWEVTIGLDLDRRTGDGQPCKPMIFHFSDAYMWHYLGWG